MSSNNNNINSYYYTCSSYPTPSILRTSGTQPQEVVIPYIYELDTNNNLNTNNEQFVTTAVQHVSSTLLHRMATMTNLVNCNNHNDPFRRGLRRGETSLIGLSGDEGTVRTEEVCHYAGDGNANIEYKDEEELEQFVDGVTGQFSGSVVVMEGDYDEADESQQLSREEEEDVSNVLAETRVDGVVDPSSVILRSAPLSSSSSSETEDEIVDAAYNYWSTQSQVQEAKSTRTQPSVPQTNNIVPKSIPTSHKFRNGNNTPSSTNCHVIQGQITLFIAHNADPFENLDGRIRDAIKDELSDERVLQQEFLNEEIVGIRLLKPVVDVRESLGSSSIAVTSPSSSNEATAATTTTSSGFASSNASIGVIGGLGGLFLLLIGLFAYTSRPRKRSRRHYLNDDDDDDMDLNSCQYSDKYDNELDAVSALFSGRQSAASWWQEPVRVTSDSFHSSSAMMDTIPTVEACYSNEGVVVGKDEDDLTAEIESTSPKVLPLSFFRKKSRLRDEETDGSSTFVKLDDDDETVDMDAHLFGNVEDSKPKKSRRFMKRLFGKKRHYDDATVDDDIVIQEIQSRATTQEDDDEIFIEETFAHEAFGIETTRAASLRPMSAYSSPTAVAGRMLQSCSSGALSSCLPAPEIGDDASNISALTDNYYDQYSGRRSPPLMRLASDAVTQCIAPTDHASVSTRSVVSRRQQQQQQQLARRGQASNAMDPFADCWNPFEGSFWRGWFA